MTICLTDLCHKAGVCAAVIICVNTAYMSARRGNGVMQQRENAFHVFIYNATEKVSSPINVFLYVK